MASSKVPHVAGLFALAFLPVRGLIGILLNFPFWPTVSDVFTGEFEIAKSQRCRHLAS
jgi:hypothetical protein